MGIPCGKAYLYGMIAIQFQLLDVGLANAMVLEIVVVDDEVALSRTSV